MHCPCSHGPCVWCLLLLFFAERDQWEDVGITSSGTASSLAPGMMRTAIDLGVTTSTMLTGAAKMAYGSVAGNEEAFKAGKEAVYGKGA